MTDSVMPIVEAGLHDLVETDHRINNEVRLISTPGHTPGHVSVVLESKGQEAVILGDTMHHPIQFTDAGIQFNFDDDRPQAEVTRRALIEHYGGRNALVFGTHFAQPAAGWIVRDGAGWRFTQSPKATP